MLASAHMIASLPLSEGPVALAAECGCVVCVGSARRFSCVVIADAGSG